MIDISNTEVMGWEAAIRGMRNPLNSWDKSDTTYGLGEDYYNDMSIGTNDLDLMRRLASAGTDHAKYRRMITVYADVVAPLYWWKEYDTYKVGTVANSCSTMHKIHDKEFTLDDFSTEHLYNSKDTEWGEIIPLSIFKVTIKCLNENRGKFIKTKDKKYWWQMIQLLPSSYNQRRTVQLNYEVLANMYRSRKSHKLDEWREFCKWVESLPYSEIITGDVKNETARENSNC